MLHSMPNLSWSVWPDLEKFCQFSNILKALVNFVRVYLVFGKILNLH